MPSTSSIGNGLKLAWTKTLTSTRSSSARLSASGDRPLDRLPRLVGASYELPPLRGAGRLGRRLRIALGLHRLPRGCWPVLRDELLPDHAHDPLAQLLHALPVLCGVRRGLRVTLPKVVQLGQQVPHVAERLRPRRGLPLFLRRLDLAEGDAHRVGHPRLRHANLLPPRLERPVRHP